MKKLILALAVTMYCTTMSAQENKPARKTAEERTERIIGKMKTDLTLSDDQVSKLKPVVLKREQRRDELRTQIDNDKEHHKQMIKDTEEEFKKILSAEQLEKLKQQRKEMHDKRMDKHREMQNKVN
ncbi:MAG TPA: hypothetical protein VFM99_11320 [Chitinophagales bacterium]|nr:hypothetical protein [Chitinophagales bacterium]